MISDSTVALRELEGTVVTLVTFLVDSHSVVGGIFYAPAHIDWPLYLVGNLLDFQAWTAGSERAQGRLPLLGHACDAGTVRDAVETERWCLLPP